MKLYVKFDDALIGDFLGGLPALIQLASKAEVYAEIHPTKKELFYLFNRPLSLNLTDNDSGYYDKRYTLSTQQAFENSVNHNLYMSQAYHSQLDIPTPPLPIKLTPDVPILLVPAYDYIVSPYARSLPDDEKWEAHHWHELFRLMPDKKFCVIGDSTYDQPLSSLPNVHHAFNESFETVANLYRKSRHGLISVVTGTSHLAFHLSTKNYLLTNQKMSWGNNPDAIQITQPITALTPETLVKILQH